MTKKKNADLIITEKHLIVILIIILAISVVFFSKINTQSKYDKIPKNLSGVYVDGKNVFIRFNMDDPKQAVLLNSLKSVCTANRIHACMDGKDIFIQEKEVYQCK